MRYVAIVILFFIYSSALAQTDAKLSASINALRISLLKKDTAMLKHLLHDRVTYGHSNGWVETEKDVISDLYNGKLVYNRIGEVVASTIIEGNVASVRSVTDVNVTVDEQQMILKLHVLQVWIKKGDEWFLLSRQSTKIN